MLDIVYLGHVFVVLQLKKNADVIVYLFIYLVVFLIICLAGLCLQLCMHNLP